MWYALIYMLAVHDAGTHCWSVCGRLAKPTISCTTERVSVNGREWSNNGCRTVQGVRLDGGCLLYVIPVCLCVRVSQYVCTGVCVC